MKTHYNLFTGKDDQYYFNLKAGNNEIILQSEGYKTEQGALKGIQSVQINCTDDSNYERKTAKDESPFFVLKAKNGEVIGRSEMYSSKQAMEKGIDSVKKNGTTTHIKGQKKPDEFHIKLNKKPYVVQDDSLTGEQILALGSFSVDQYCLFLIKGNEQQEIAAQDSVKMKNGLRFQAIINDIKFG